MTVIDHLRFADAEGYPLCLGMPHLDPHGLDLRWLLREACHLHWQAIAERAGVTPSRLADGEGNRVLPSVVACVVSGQRRSVAEDDPARLDQPLAPCAENGWRSITALTTARGAVVTAELVTAFVTRGAAGNSRLYPATMPPAFAVPPEAPEGDRARNLRARGRANRDSAPARPHAIIERAALSAVDFNGVGLFYFANYPNLFASAEAAALSPHHGRFAAHRREIHYFGNVDCGERLEIATETRATGLAPDVELVLGSWARRLSDSRVVAYCETTMRPVSG